MPSFSSTRSFILSTLSVGSISISISLPVKVYTRVSVWRVAWRTASWSGKQTGRFQRRSGDQTRTTADDTHGQKKRKREKRLEMMMKIAGRRSNQQITRVCVKLHTKITHLDFDQHPGFPFAGFVSDDRPECVPNTETL